MEDTVVHGLKTFAEKRIQWECMQQRCIKEQLQGYQLLKKWEKDRGRYRRQVYQDSTARDCYCLEYMPKRVGTTQNTVDTFINKNSSVLGNRGSISLLSLGCGPMSDVIGVRRAFAKRGLLVNGKAVDAADWSEYCSEYNRISRESSFDFCHSNAENFVMFQPNKKLFDLTIIIYADAFQFNSPFWTKLKTISNCILVVDNNRKPVNAVMSANGFQIEKIIVPVKSSTCTWIGNQHTLLFTAPMSPSQPASPTICSSAFELLANQVPSRSSTAGMERERAAEKIPLSFLSYGTIGKAENHPLLFDLQLLEWKEREVRHRFLQVLLEQLERQKITLFRSSHIFFHLQLLAWKERELWQRFIQDLQDLLEQLERQKIILFRSSHNILFDLQLLAWKEGEMRQRFLKDVAVFMTASAKWSNAAPGISCA